MPMGGEKDGKEGGETTVKQKQIAVRRMPRHFLWKKKTKENLLEG